ncbi:hypothetical protein BC833DRAFT_573296 [Globomyces pollinis-pini]|nr:hypothetical protein BC833DRAFT_573296 [Globomyces pollinis-pini]
MLKFIQKNLRKKSKQSPSPSSPQSPHQFLEEHWDDAKLILKLAVVKLQNAATDTPLFRRMIINNVVKSICFQVSSLDNLVVYIENFMDEDNLEPQIPSLVKNTHALNAQERMSSFVLEPEVSHVEEALFSINFSFDNTFDLNSMIDIASFMADDSNMTLGRDREDDSTLASMDELRSRDSMLSSLYDDDVTLSPIDFEDEEDLEEDKPQPKYKNIHKFLGISEINTNIDCDEPTERKTPKLKFKNIHAFLGISPVSPKHKTSLQNCRSPPPIRRSFFENNSQSPVLADGDTITKKKNISKYLGMDSNSPKHNISPKHNHQQFFPMTQQMLI